MFGTGDLDIYTAGDSPEAVLMGLREPHEIKTMILPQWLISTKKNKRSP